MANQKLGEATGNMTKFCRKIVRIQIRWDVIRKLTRFRRFFTFVWERILVYSTRMPHYRRLSPEINTEQLYRDEEDPNDTDLTTSSSQDYAGDSDLVSLKISLLGDCQIGKTSFMVKYIGDDMENRSLEMKGVNLMDKIIFIRDAKIALKLWDVGGDKRSFDQVPIACKDAVVILFMFDLTSRCTLNSVIDWYSEAKKWNQTAIPILIGTKFDDFVQLPPDIQWTIVTQARAYAKAMKATLFFSSATHNINVNKIFKFIMAKLFNLPWTVQKNLTIGEPIIDF